MATPTVGMSVPTTSAGGDQGSAWGRGPQGWGRGRGRGGNCGGRTGTAHSLPHFKGHTTEVGGHVFQVFHENSNPNQFARTVKALGEYFVKNMKYAGDILPLTHDLKGLVVAKPADIPANEKVHSVIFEWEKDYADYITCRNILASNLKAAYTIIWGQCSETMWAKVKLSTEYTAKSATCDCEWLLKTIRGVTLKFDGQHKIHCSISDAHGTYHLYRPAPDVMLAVYLEEFSALVDTIEHYG